MEVFNLGFEHPHEVDAVTLTMGRWRLVAVSAPQGISLSDIRWPEKCLSGIVLLGLIQAIAASLQL
jgi:hypothetical protein